PSPRWLDRERRDPGPEAPGAAPLADRYRQPNARALAKLESSRRCPTAWQDRYSMQAQALDPFPIATALRRYRDRCKFLRRIRPRLPAATASAPEMFLTPHPESLGGRRCRTPPSLC